MDHKAGFVNIIGNPNVGKSTLINALVGERLSIITSKVQTTRHRILGILNTDNYQIVLSDTPGILKPKYELHNNMMTFVKNALIDADVMLYITDTIEEAELLPEIAEKLNKIKIPLFLIINKIDAINNLKELEAKERSWKQILPNAQTEFISALNKTNTDALLNKIVNLLPASPPYFEKDALTDKPERFFASEIVREKILLNYKQEIPYSVEVEIDSFKEKEDIIHISSVIYVARNSQKGIIIGHKGSALKKTGTEARKDLEAFFGKKIFLELFVKVKKDWRNNTNMLKNFGY